MFCLSFAAKTVPRAEVFTPFEDVYAMHRGVPLKARDWKERKDYPTAIIWAPAFTYGMEPGQDGYTRGKHAGRQEIYDAALDMLTDAERESFTKLNTDYVAKHGFPFIIAVRDPDMAGILAAFERRVGNDRETEFAEACKQVERIARLRLEAILP